MDNRVESELEGRLARVEAAILGVAGYRQDRILNWTAGWVGLPNPEILEPGIWELRACKARVAQVASHPEANYNCSKCGWSELYTGLDGIDRRRCRFNAPETPCIIKNWLADGEMGLTGIEAWTANGATPTITKIPSPIVPPVPSGNGRALQILQAAAVSGAIYASQVCGYGGTTGRLFRIRGYGRCVVNTTGTSLPYVSLVGVGTLWLGINSTNWQSIDAVFYVPATVTRTLGFGMATPNATNDSIQFANLTLEEVDPNFGHWNNVLDTDWCSHFQLVWQPAYNGEQVWWMLGDQALVGQNPWGYPTAVLAGAPGEPLDVAAPRRVLVDSNRYNKFRAAIPNGMTLTATLVAPAWGAR